MAGNMMTEDKESLTGYLYLSTKNVMRDRDHMSTYLLASSITIFRQYRR